SFQGKCSLREGCDKNSLADARFSAKSSSSEETTVAEFDASNVVVPSVYLPIGLFNLSSDALSASFCASVRPNSHTIVSSAALLGRTTCIVTPSKSSSARLLQTLAAPTRII